MLGAPARADFAADREWPLRRFRTNIGFTSGSQAAPDHPVVGGFFHEPSVFYATIMVWLVRDARRNRDG